MKNTIKILAVFCLFCISICCDNGTSQAKLNRDSEKVFSHVNYADEMIVEDYIRDSLESAKNDSLAN